MLFLLFPIVDFQSYDHNKKKKAKVEDFEQSISPKYSHLVKDA